MAEVDRSRILVSRLGEPDVLAPEGSPPPSAPPSPPGSGYASTQAYDEGREDELPPPPLTPPPPPPPPASPAPPTPSAPAPPPLVLPSPITPGPRMRIDESETPHNPGPSCDTSPRRCIGCNDGRCYYYYGRQSQ